MLTDQNCVSIGRDEIALSDGIDINMNISLQEESKSQDVEKYDYFQLVTFDIHAIPRGRVVAKRKFKYVTKCGLGLLAGISFHGCRDLRIPGGEYFGEHFGNQHLRPVMETLVDVQKTVRGRFQVGQVLCDIWRDPLTKEMTTPRTMAETQLNRLQSKGILLCSSAEIEMAFRDVKTGDFLDNVSQVANMTRVHPVQELLLEFVEELQEIDIAVDSVLSECSPGCFEFTTDITKGIKGMDAIARFRPAASAFFKKRGLKTDFKCKIFDAPSIQALQLNISLWTPDGKNLFYDATKPGKLSADGRYWVSGLLDHIHGLICLGYPTVSCYWHFKDVPLASNNPYWGFDDRRAPIRVKAEGENVYMEYRLASSAANPYLLAAGVVAAGLDGLERKLVVEKLDTGKRLATDLDSALRDLESDAYLVEALGVEFVKHFAMNKRYNEIDPLTALCEGVTDDSKKVMIERNFYETHYDV